MPGLHIYTLIWSSVLEQIWNIGNAEYDFYKFLEISQGCTSIDGK